MKSKRPIILAGMILPENKEEFDDIFDECKELCRACMMEPVGTITQNLEHPDTRYGFGKGKFEELVELVKETKAESVVFANNISITVAKRIQEETEVTVLDRTSLILTIFGLRAKTKKASLQVQLARMQYDLPRLTLDMEKESHLRGGGYRNRGAGEMRSAQIKSIYKKRIKDVKQQLSDLDDAQQLAQIRRNKSSLGQVALVGYTNAGKSSLMNAMLAYNKVEDRSVFEKDMLFATLDTSVRNMKYKNYEFLLYDTVGFVSDLPKTLLDAFYSTLDAARNADVLLHVIDVSNPDWQKKAMATEDTLRKINAQDIPVIRVFNKCDLVDGEVDGIATSCKNMTGIENLLKEITNTLYPREETMTCLLPYAKMALIEENRSVLDMEEVEMNEQGIVLCIRGEKTRMIPFQSYKIKEDN